MKSQLSIGFDAKRIMKNTSGLGSYGRTLINNLSTSEDIDIHLYSPSKGREGLRKQIIERENVHFHYWAGGLIPYGSSYWRSHGIIHDLKRDGIQLYHGLSGELPIGIHKSGIKSVVTIHDLIFLHHPEFYRQHDAKVYSWKFRHTIKEADHFIAISECTKRDLIEYGHVDEDRISLIYQSCSPRFSVEYDKSVLERVRQKYALPQRYILNVGTIEVRKNILQAVKALHYLPEDIALVIIGSYKVYTKKVIEYVKAHHLNHRVLLLHDVPDEDLPAIYTQAEVFVYPSLYEGFGLPILEAINCGLPVVTCSGSSLEEAGGPDCTYVTPNDEVGMANAILMSLEKDAEREQKIAKCQESVRRFQSRDLIEQMFKLYRSLL